MAKLTLEQSVAAAAIQLLINDWAFELDVNNGLAIANLVTEDCNYTVRNAPRIGRDAVCGFYKERYETLAAQPGGVPVQRHTLSNLRLDFKSGTEAAITFTLVFYTTMGMSSGTKHADPAAVADVRMNVRADADGEWRIAMFDSNQTFVRIPS